MFHQVLNYFQINAAFDGNNYAAQIKYYVFVHSEFINNKGKTENMQVWGILISGLPKDEKF